MKICKKGFTLVEILAVIVILGIVAAVVIPSIYSVMNESKEKEYTTIISTIEENGLLYADRHKEEVLNDINTIGYHIITLNDLIDDGLLEAPIVNPVTKENIDLNKNIFLTTEAGSMLSACFEDRDCYIPTQLYNKLEELKLEGADPAIQGLHYDFAKDYSYYKGENPNNWVEFNGLLWRIVTMNGTSQNHSIKIIYEGNLKKESTVQNGKIGSYIFNSTSSNNYDNNLSIKTYLQNWYDQNITSDNKALVEAKNWCIGKTTYNAGGVTKATFLNNNCLTQTASQLSMGMLSGSDYLNASTDTGCTSSTTTACKNANYLSKSYEYYTITGETAGSDVWYVGNTLATVSAVTNKEIRPVLYLTANTLVDRGTGSFESPYRVKLSIAADQTAPVITMIDNSNINIIKGQAYNDAGATANDNIDGDITHKITVISNVNINALGTYYVKYKVTDRAGNISILTRTVNVINSYNFVYTGASQTFSVPLTGKYRLEVWGAQGGGLNNTGGKGGYAVGVTNLTAGNTLYVYVGQQGSNVGTGVVSFGGGGYSENGSTSAAGGGGASDIRIGTNSLYARAIVAGGGGGGRIDVGTGAWISGGYGGGLTGGKGSSNSDGTEGGTGGTQTAPGTGWGGTGSFGLGGSEAGGTGSGGGGSGWYGGGAGSTYTFGGSLVCPGGGGSGWIYTASSFATWQTTNPSVAVNWLLNSTNYLTSASTISGNALMPLPSGGNETGHSGNGYAKITYLN